MGADQIFDWNQAAASALDWWRDAGVDVAIDEQPRNWLVPPAPSAVAPAAEAVAPIGAQAGALPDSLAEFVAWRSGPDAPEAAWHGRGIEAAGDPAADIMILVDMPEREDADNGVLLSGAAGKLFDRMLAAIGRDRGSVYLAAVCVSRPVAGRIPPEIEGRLAELATRHVALAGPKRVLLMGNAPSRALLGMEFLRARGGLRPLNLDAGTVSVEVEAVASFHPRYLLERPTSKAEAWKDLQMLIEGLQS